MTRKYQFRGANSGHLAPKDGGGVRCAKNYEIAIGQLANLVTAERTEAALLLFSVIDIAIRDVAGVNPSFEFDADDFTYNLPEAKAFLLGHRGGLYYDALGIDRDEARRIIERWLSPELAAIDKIATCPQDMPTLAERMSVRLVSLLAVEDRPMWIEDMARELKASRGNVLAAANLLVSQGKVTMHQFGRRHLYSLVPISVAA